MKINLGEITFTGREMAIVGIVACSVIAILLHGLRRPPLTLDEYEARFGRG